VREELWTRFLQQHQPQWEAVKEQVAAGAVTPEQALLDLLN
jgi:hypothetical protein